MCELQGDMGTDTLWLYKGCDDSHVQGITLRFPNYIHHLIVSAVSNILTINLLTERVGMGVFITKSVAVNFQC